MDSHVVYLNKSRIVSEVVTSFFAETNSNVGEAVSALLSLSMYQSPFADFVFGEEAARRVLPEGLRTNGESCDEEQVLDVVRGLPARVRNGTESRGSTFVDVIKAAKLMAASVFENEIDSSKTANCKY